MRPWTMGVTSALAVLALAGGAGALELPAEWKAAEQAGLAQELANAPALAVEELGTAVYGIDDPDNAGINRVPNPDGKSYDIILWYRKAYRQSQRVYIVDLGSGGVKKHEFRDEEGKIRVDCGFSWFGVLARNGKLYGAAPDWSKHGNGGETVIYQYDPATNEMTRYKSFPGVGGERNPLAYSQNGWVYGAGSYLRMDEHRDHRVAVYGFNPETGEEKFFGPVGPRITGTAYGYSMGCDDKYAYVACGQIPWFLVAVNVKTGEQKVLADAPEGGFPMRMYVNSNQARYGGGATAYVQKGDDAPKKYYWLYHGELIPKKVDSWEMDDACPWPADLKSPVQAAPPAPELHTRQLYPDAKGRAVLWWRPKAGEGEWRSVTIDGIELHPLVLHRIFALADGRLFGTGQGYKGRFLVDPKTGKITYLGDGGGSLYGLVNCGGKLYWSGYPSAPIYEFDPAKPWTLEKSGPPGTQSPPETTAESNPRRVHEDYSALYKKTRVKKMLSAALGGDGRVYFGGKGQRDYDGGGLSWYDPATGAVDGLWKPFAGKDIGWVTPACAGRYIVIGTETDTVYLFDTKEGRLLEDQTFKPVPGARMSGPILEGAPGRMIGVAHDPAKRDVDVLYGVEVPSGKVVFTKFLPATLPFDWGHGIGHWDYQLGPDGFIWTTVQSGVVKALVRIDPRDARVQVLGKLDPLGHVAFSGRDLYLTGSEQLRVVRNIVPAAE